MRVFGPIPSRRLGRSLGINNIPIKVCSYSCVYCQVGATRKFQLERQEFYNPTELCEEVKEKVAQIRERGEVIDYLSFVPDGEPTLDINLGLELKMLEPLGIKTAVITNSSLLTDQSVRQDLFLADWVSVKVDSVLEEVWRKVDVPHPKLSLDMYLEGIRRFASEYTGELVTETMLVDGVNDNEESLKQTADFLTGLGAKANYISIPTRPPARSWVHAPKEEIVNRAYQIYSNKLKNVEYLIGYEGNLFTSTGDVEKDLLSITAVHPMRKDAVQAFLEKGGASFDIIGKLIEEQKLKQVDYEGKAFYLRHFGVK